MSIRNTTITQLRQMEDQEGLVLQGCGGSLQEWQDGINQLLTEEGILQGGTKFEDVCVFQNEGCTCLLFPFTPEVQLDMGKLALWRIRSSGQFGGMWLSDYVDIKLGGYIQDQPMKQKPDCPLIGQDGNIHKHHTAAQGGFKGNEAGSEPEYNFHWHGGGGVLYFFEAPIDMLSFISLYKHCWKSQSYAAACGVSDRVLWQMLKDGPHIQKVYLCLDNDEAGQKAAGRISKQLTEKGITNELLIPERKDWNEELLHYRKGEVVSKV